MTEYTDEDLLDGLRTLGEVVGGRPTVADLGERDDLPTYGTYRRRFGSWGEALEAAGFETGSVSKADCIEMLQDLAADLGRTPTHEDVNEREDLPHVWTFQDRFGSWSAALKAAGFGSNPGTPIDDETLLDELESLTRELGRVPSGRDMDEHGAFSENVYLRHFGAWDDALAELNLPPAPPRNRLSERELIEDLREYANYSGPGRTASPSKRQLNEDGPHPYNVYTDRFGSWPAALVQAGLDPRERLTPADVLTEIRRVAVEVGLDPDGSRAPTVEDLYEHGEISLHKVTTEFGNWNEAVSAAGFVPNEGRPTYSNEYSDADLLAEVRRVAGELHETPTLEEFETLSEVASTTFERRFGSWHRTLELAGLRPRRQSPGGTPRGASSAIERETAPGTPTDPRIDRVRITDTDGVLHIVAVDDVLVDELSPLKDYRVVSIDATPEALAPIWRVETQPVRLEKPLMRMFYGDELAERLSGRILFVRSADNRDEMTVSRP